MPRIKTIRCPKGAAERQDAIVSTVTLDRARHYLSLCGYSDSLLCADFRFGGDRTAPLAAFAHEPADARSACIAVIDATTLKADVRPDVTAYRQLGAPIVVALRRGSLEFWKQREGDAELVDEVAANKAEAYFRSHASTLGPDAVFRAKTWGRLDRQFQLSFVDAGLMPLVEMEAGEKLTKLIERVVHQLRRTLYPNLSQVSVSDGHWLLKSAFWLLAAKILRDKEVPGFKRVDLLNVEDVFAKVARHYHSRNASSVGIDVRTRKQRSALGSAAQSIDEFSHLGHVTTESLAYVYESALITKDTRALLGTHSTPQYLVDYVVWKLAPWINQIDPDLRDVFEPACGHAAFLVAAMRLLKELLPAERQADRKDYLRAHLHGVEIDPFAIEIARLSLTLADIPNSNGWDLTCGSMFANQLLAKKASHATILLGNPPFENFTKADRAEIGGETGQEALNNKTAEVLAQTLSALPVGGVFGFVVPQGILFGKNTDPLRRMLCEEFELKEICLFADKVFSFSDAESAILVGRRVESSSLSHAVSCRRVREADMDAFRMDYRVSSKRDISQEVLCRPQDAGFIWPDLPQVWQHLQAMMRLDDVAEIGEGLSYRSDLPHDVRCSADRKFPGAVRGFMKLGRTLQTHSHPPEVWMNVSPDVLGPARMGADMVPQVLLNHARASRGPWRIKAFIDRDGHAFTNNYNAVRPKERIPSLEFLWALLNSPLANAYAFAHARGRHNLPGVLAQMPIPPWTHAEHESITQLVSEYHRIAGSGNSREALDSLRELALRIDALILQMYDLPPRLEREVLDLFANQPRVGVPFEQERYFPVDFEPWLHLHEYLSDEFENSKASALLQSHRTFELPEVSEALRRATEDFEE